MYTHETSATKPIMEIWSPDSYHPKDILSNSGKTWPVKHTHYAQVLIQKGPFGFTEGSYVQMQL